CAQLGRAVGGRRRGDVGRALGDEGDRVALAVLPEADVAEVPPDQRRLVVGGLDVLPLGDDELGVLAVAVVLALGPGLAVDGERVDRKSTRLKLQSRENLVCRLLLEKKKLYYT